MDRVLTPEQALQERMEENQRRLAAAQRQLGHEQAQLQQLLLDRIPRALLEAHEAAIQAHEIAERDLAAARARHEQHSSQRPLDPTQARAWVKEKAELAGELEVYEGIVTQRRAELGTARQQLGQAVDRAWYAERNRQLQAIEAAQAGFNEEMRKAREAVEETRKREGAKVDQARARLDWIDRARPEHLPRIARSALDI